MALSSLTIFGNYVQLNSPFALVPSTDWNLAASWLGSNVKGSFSGVITYLKMTVSAATSPNLSFNGIYFYNGVIYDTSATPVLTTDYSGIFDGSDAIKYTIPASSTNCWVSIDLPLAFTMKKLYHNCPATSTSIGVVFKGSNDNGATWTTVATHTMTHTNKDTANVPTILSSDTFKTFKWEFTNNLASDAQIWVLDFVGDFYPNSVNSVLASNKILRHEFSTMYNSFSSMFPLAKHY